MSLSLPRIVRWCAEWSENLIVVVIVDPEIKPQISRLCLGTEPTGGTITGRRLFLFDLSRVFLQP